MHASRVHHNSEQQALESTQNETILPRRAANIPAPSFVAAPNASGLGNQEVGIRVLRDQANHASRKLIGKYHMSARHNDLSLETLPRLFRLALAALILLSAVVNLLVSAAAEEAPSAEDYANWRKACYIAYAMENEGRGRRPGHVHPDDIRLDMKALRIKFLDAGTDINEVRIKYPSSIEQHIFGQQAENGALRLGFVLKRELEEARVAHYLKPDEQKKVHLAGQGDVARFISKAAILHDRYTRNGILLTEVQAFRLELATLRAHVEREDLFDSRSLFGKALKRIVMEPKRMRVEGTIDNSFAVENHLRWLEQELEQVHPVQEDQKENLRKVLEQSFKQSPVIIWGDRHEQTDRLSEISDAEYRKALTQAQLELLRDYLQYARVD
jgi:hypothetical protein